VYWITKTIIPPPKFPVSPILLLHCDNWFPQISLFFLPSKFRVPNLVKFFAITKEECLLPRRTSYADCHTTLWTIFAFIRNTLLLFLPKGWQFFPLFLSVISVTLVPSITQRVIVTVENIWLLETYFFVVPWRTRRSWRRRHCTRTTLRGKNLWPVSGENHHQSNIWLPWVKDFNPCWIVVVVWGSGRHFALDVGHIVGQLNYSRCDNKHWLPCTITPFY